MIFDRQLALLSIVIAGVTSIQPNCDKTNQFRRYCFPVEYCNRFVCSASNCGHFIINSYLVKIKDTQLIPKCAFSNSPDLKYIHGVNSEIRVLASGSFVNLPNLESIDLSFNLIRELHHGTFKNVVVSLLDLSWNKIIYIPEGAFEGLSGLKYLNLSKNELKTLPVQDMPPLLVELNLSYNLFNMMALKSSRFPHLTKIDLSHNILEGVALLFENPISKIDLAHNRLSSIDFFDVQDCDELEIPSNYFTKVPEFLTYANIKRVSIYPNPWNCDELSKLWTHLQNNFINVLIKEKSNETDQGSPICTNAEEKSKSTSGLGDERNCAKDSHCEDHMICRSLKCWDPCKENVCDATSVCETTKHRFDCLCPGTLKRDPMDIYSPCHDVECISDSDCSDGKLCNNNRTCISFGGFPSSAGSSYYSRPQTENGSSQFSFGQSSEYSPSQSAGYPSGGTSQISTQGENLFSGGNKTFGGSSGGYGGGAGFSGGSSYGSSSGSSYGSSYDSYERPVEEDEPWWFYEIPMLAPSNKSVKH